jgi:uncharacterized sulfatase
MRVDDGRDVDGVDLLVQCHRRDGSYVKTRLGISVWEETVLVSSTGYRTDVRIGQYFTFPPRVSATPNRESDTADLDTMTTGNISGTVLVTVDSLRADALDGTDTRRSGSFADLVDRGTTFENAFAHGNWTPFSFPSILGANHVFASDGGIGVGDGPTLAETLSDAGVHTAGFNAANGFLTPYWGYDRGFDTFETFTSDAGESVYSRYLTAHPTVQAWLQFASAPFRGFVDRLRGRDVDHVTNTSRMNDLEAEAVSFLESVSEPFFLWVHYMDVHTPYVPAPRYVTEAAGGGIGALQMLRTHARAGLGREVGTSALADLRNLYRGANYQVDESVGRLLDALERLGLREETLVVFAGDHGEEFQEHGHLAHYPKLYEELIHVPLVVDHPEVDGGSVDVPVGLDAVAPTIAGAMGAETSAYRGESVLGSVVDGEPLAGDPVFSVAVRGESVTQQPIPRHRDDGELLVSGRTRRYTYILHTESRRRELYDRERDPDERENVWDEIGDDPGPAELAAATERYAARLGERGDAGAGQREGPPAEVDDRLKALGYQ